MVGDNATVTTVAKVLGGVCLLLLAPVALPIMVATNYRGTATRLSSIPGVSAEGTRLSGVVVFIYIAALIALVGGGVAATVGFSGGPSTAGASQGTPTPDQRVSNWSLGPSTMQIVSTSLSNETIRRGETVPVKVTVKNTGDTTGYQTVEYRTDGEMQTWAGVRLAAGETTTVTLDRLQNTSSYSLGTHEFTFRTVNDTATATLHVDYASPTHAWAAKFNRTADTLAIEKVTVPSEDRVKVVFNANSSEVKEYTDTYQRGTAEPVPEAVVRALTNSPNAPDTMTLSVIHVYNVNWRVNITESLARRYASGEITPVEFRAELRQRATGSRAGVTTIRIRERFIYPHGDRARRGYAQGLAKHLRNVKDADINVVDAGLYNTSYYIPNTIEKVDPHSSIFVTVAVNPKTEHESIRYRGLNTGKAGVIGGHVVAHMGEMMDKHIYGEIPQSLNLRWVNKTSGEIYRIERIPTRYMKNTDDFRPGLGLWVQIGLVDKLVKYENEDSW